MTLGELITELESMDPDLICDDGFGDAHSYRGVYRELAFEPQIGVTVAEMLETARGALGATFQGYKGGDYTMGAHTLVHLAGYGGAGEPMTKAMLGSWALRAAGCPHCGGAL